MSEFRDSLQHHLQQTRAGLYGQFEHAFNFEQGFDQDPKYKMAPGESITFTGKLLSGPTVTLIATNRLTGAAGTGFVAQTSDPNSATVFVGSPQDKGQVELAFSAPSGGGAGSTSSITNFIGGGGTSRWEAYDAADVRIFSKSHNTGGNFPGILDIIREAGDGDYYTVSRSSNGTTLQECNPGGTVNWSLLVDSSNGGVQPHVAHDSASDVVCVAFKSGNRVATVQGYDASLVGGPTTALWSVDLPSDFNNISSVRDMKIGRAASAGFVFVSVNSPFTGPTVHKIDTSNGTVVVSYNTAGRSATRLAINSLGQVVVSGPANNTPETGPSASVFLLDENLVRLNSQANGTGANDMDWTPAGVRFDRPLVVSVTVDAADNIYFVEGSGYMLKFDPTLTTRTLSKRVVGVGTINNRTAATVFDIGHDQSSELIFASGGPFFGNDTFIERYDNNGDLIRRFQTPDPSQSPQQLHVLPSGAGGPGPDLGACFTSELSTRPPGRIASIAAVKYQAQNVTDIFFNSCQTEDVDKDGWSAVHSVHGDIPFGPDGQWDYHSPL